MRSAQTPADSRSPLISVIMPAYNRADYIRQAVESVLAQEGPAFELIVVDDGSTDSTPEILREYPPQTVRYLRQENRGPGAARNAGLGIARGELIAFLDSDDYYLPGKLAAQARLLKTDRRYGAVHSGWQTVDEQGILLQTEEPWTDAPILDLKTWLMWKPVFLGGILIRADWLRKAGPFNPRLFQTDDVEMMFRLAAAGCRMRWLKQPTVCYRQHSANITRDGFQQAADLHAAIDSFFATKNLPAKAQSLEPQVRYYTLLWTAFDLWRRENIPLMTDYLQRTAPFIGQTGEQIPVVWHSHLIRRALEFRMPERKIAGLAEIVDRIPVPGNPDPARVRKILDWLSRLWWEYLQGRRPDPGKVTELSSGLEIRVMVKSLQTALMTGACRDSVRRLETFWGDLLRTGSVPAPQRWEVTTLYLTIFAQSVFRRQWGSAAEGLRFAIRAGATWRALPAWGRFLRAAGEYFLSPKQGKTNRIADAKRRIQ